MDKSDPKNIIKKHYRKLIKLITIVNKHFETESIHELRVEYKKLRAFLRMISEEKDAEQKIKIPGKLKKAYHIAGSIRDLQLQCKSILAITEEETKKPKSYLKLIEQQIKKLKPEFSDIPLAKTIKKSIKKTGELTVEKINIIQSGKFINNNCTAIMAIITSRNFDDVNMHAIR
ncbi:MAG TPA: CHAD domain-containing protein, partial [Ginsengibacter sp.]